MKRAIISQIKSAVGDGLKNGTPGGGAKDFESHLSSQEDDDHQPMASIVSSKVSNQDTSRVVPVSV